FELTAYPVLGSNTTPSDPAPIAGDATTLPASGSEIAITRLPQTEKRRRFFTSIASPEGPSHGFSEYRLVTAAFAASISTISLVSSTFTYTCPLSSATENSGLPPIGIVPTTMPVLASIAVELLPRPLNVKTRPVFGSKRIESGLSPVATWLIAFRVL